MLGFCSHFVYIISTLARQLVWPTLMIFTSIFYPPLIGKSTESVSELKLYLIRGS